MEVEQSWLSQSLAAAAGRQASRSDVTQSPACVDLRSPDGHLVSACSSIGSIMWLGFTAGEECYCVLDKGPINEGHVLLLPIEHYVSSLACSPTAWAEMQRYLSALKACAASQVSPALPCPAMPGCAVPGCAVLSCAMPCPALPCCAVLCPAVPCCACQRWPHAVCLYLALQCYVLPSCAKVCACYTDGTSAEFAICVVKHGALQLARGPEQ